MTTYLQITFKVPAEKRKAALGIFYKNKEIFLYGVAGAQSKTLLVRDEDLQILHRFSSVKMAEIYLSSEVCTVDIVAELGPLLDALPDIRLYEES
ncbi:MAG: hypothetical protein COC19_04755 [SAR86 cluster bacterium]|uniref:Uncharacterized protein n=1 Tax=SAR86 cluster bacterium TaxID=2030880 RepID=A0A2A4MMW1_9GAMM|nr:MAG: hypothetical protein COC19_04755 [SAR86 cluster bacterium]